MKVFIDFETYYDTKAKYDLKHLSITEYVRDGRFKVHGCAVALDDGITRWFPSEKLNEFFSRVNWAEADVVGHNIKFDGAILSWHFGISPLRWIDTKGMAKAILGGSIKNHSLAEVAAFYGFAPKGVMKADGLVNLDNDQALDLAYYCVHDVELCRSIFKRLEVCFPQREYSFLDWSVRCFVSPKLKIDVDVAQQVHNEEVKRREAFFLRPGFERENFSSNPKFAKLLSAQGYEVPLKTSPRTKEKIPALAVGDVEFLDMMENGDEQLKQLCEARVVAKSNLLETRAKKLHDVGLTGPWPFDVEYSGAAQTHRFSGGKGAGGNPQNFPRTSSLRDCIITDSGSSLVVGDFSNIELRIVSYLAKETALVTMIEAGEDIYCDFATKFYGRKVTKENKPERQFGKVAILGLGYGMGAAKFAKTVRLQTGKTITEDEAKKAVALYRGYYPNIVALWERYDRELFRMASGKPFSAMAALSHGSGSSIKLPSGLEIKFPGLKAIKKGYEYQAYRAGTKAIDTVKIYGGKLLENISQALAGEICKLAIGRLVELGWDAVGMVHDEILMIVKDEEIESARAAMKTAMETPPRWWPEIKLECEIGAGKSWKKAKS